MSSTGEEEELSSVGTGAGPRSASSTTWWSVSPRTIFGRAFQTVKRVRVSARLDRLKTRRPMTIDPCSLR